MKLMVIDTALGACLAGMFEVAGDQVTPLGVRREEMFKGHQERLGGMARDAVTEAGGFDGIERVGVTVGPGSFTGLRVGLSFAQGLGAARDVPVVGLSVLDGLAASVDPEGLVVALIDARRNQVYMRAFRNGQAVTEAAALPLDEAAAQIAQIAAGGAIRLVGTGAAVLQAHDAGLAQAETHPLVAPTAEALARLTAQFDAASHPPRPLYLRAPDATPPTRLPGQPRHTNAL